MDLPKAFLERMEQLLGEEYPAFAAALCREERYAGVRIVKPAARDAVLSLMSGAERVPWCPDGYYADKRALSGAHPYHMAGLVYFQEPSAMAAVEALDVQPGDYVLDLCAAPGGKATQAGAKLSGRGLLVANELVPKRAAILAENIERCGVGNCVVTNEEPARLAARFPAVFDKIIVDAPCSGEGMFRKEPQAAAHWSIEHTLSCAVRQKKILDSAVKMLRPGGKLVYSTCTFAPCENEGVAADLLDTYPDLELLPIPLTGLSDGCGAWADTARDLSRTKRIFPHRQRGEGHFIALFQKAGAAERKAFAPWGKEPAEAALFREFEKQFLNKRMEGMFRLFGEHLYLIPEGLPLDGIKTVRAGLHLGVCKKGRFEPGHAFLRTLRKDCFRRTLDFPAADERLSRYLRGETVPADGKGWAAVCVDGFPLGWGKAADGVLKNHFPKHLRLKQ